MLKTYTVTANFVATLVVRTQIEVPDGIAQYISGHPILSAYAEDAISFQVVNDVEAESPEEAEDEIIDWAADWADEQDFTSEGYSLVVEFFGAEAKEFEEEGLDD